MRLFLMTCVAVIPLTIVGCSQSSTSPSSDKEIPGTSTTAADVPSSTRPLVPTELDAYPPGYDEWKQWSSGQSSTELDALFEQFGLSEGSAPRQEMVDEGFIAVAKLGSACIISFLSVQGDSGLLSVAILSRFSPDGLAQGLQNGDVAGIKRFIDDYRQVCTPGVPA